MAKKITAAELNENVLDKSYHKMMDYRACIYRVPDVVRKVNGSAYTPCLVSIGPFHKRNGEEKHLQSHMEFVKNCYVNDFFVYVGKKLERVGLAMMDECLEQMEKLIDRAKGCYAVSNEEEDAALDAALDARMLVVDGCFILEVLRRYTEDILPFSTGGGHSSSTTNTNLPRQKKTTEEEPTPDDRIFDHPLMRVGILRDLLLLENQLPYFVLEKLMHLTLGRVKDLPLEDYILNYFHGILKIGHNCPEDRDHGYRIDVKDKSKDKDDGINHILHVLHQHYLPQEVKDKSQDDKFEERVYGQHNKFMHYASDLDAVAVEFKGNNKFDVQFKSNTWYRKACFDIPTLSIYDSTEIVLRNLIAFEQCHPDVPRYFTSYASLMDRLIETKDDVQVLVEAGVIVNNLGSCKDVSNLFNNLSKEVVLGKFYFLKPCMDAADYSQHHRSAWLLVTFRYLHRRWSANPSTFIAFGVALLAFLMQVAGFITNYVRG